MGEIGGREKLSRGESALELQEVRDRDYGEAKPKTDRAQNLGADSSAGFQSAL